MPRTVEYASLSTLAKHPGAVKFLLPPVGLGDYEQQQGEKEYVFGQFQPIRSGVEISWQRFAETGISCETDPSLSPIVEE